MKINFISKSFRLFFIISFCWFAAFTAFGQITCGWEKVTAISNKLLQKKPKEDNSPYYDGRILDDIFFADDKSGWIVGGDDIVLTTKNGGKSWTSQSLKVKKLYKSFRTTGLFFLDSKEGWASGSAEGKAIVYHTVNGGKNWKILHRMEDSKISFISEIIFTDSKQGFGVGHIDNKHTIWKTEDGGYSWKELYYFADGSDITSFELISNNDILVGMIDFILQSTDAGKTWQKVYSDNGSPSIWDFEFVSKTEGWAVGANGRLLKTSDGGKSWQRIDLPGEVTKDTWFTGVKFIDSKRGWIAGTKELIISTCDGGKTWRVEHFKEDNGEVLQKMAFTSSDIFTIGTNGLILKSSIANCEKN